MLLHYCFISNKGYQLKSTSNRKSIKEGKEQQNTEGEEDIGCNMDAQY